MDTGRYSGSFQQHDGTYVHVMKNDDGSYTFTRKALYREVLSEETLTGVEADQKLAQLRAASGRA